MSAVIRPHARIAHAAEGKSACGKMYYSIVYTASAVRYGLADFADRLIIP